MKREPGTRQGPRTLTSASTASRPIGPLTRRPKTTRITARLTRSLNCWGENTMSKTQELAREIKRAKKKLGLNGDSQQDLLKRVREAFELTNEELAQALDVSPDT